MFFAGLVESFFPPYLNLCLFSGYPDALCNGLSNAIEVFDDEESNEVGPFGLFFRNIYVAYMY